MKNSSITTVLIAMLVLGSASIGQALDYGKPAPVVSLKLSDGSELDLSKGTGKLVILEFIDPGCGASTKFYSSGAAFGMEKKFGWRKDVDWVTIVPASGAKAGRELHERYGFPDRKLVVDTDGSLAESYGIKHYSTYFILNLKGLVVYQGAPDNAPKEFAEGEERKAYLRNALEDLTAGKQLRNWQSDTYGCVVK